MPKFPDAVITAMHHAATTVTCLPVQRDGNEWRAAIFYVMPESFTKDQAQQLFPAGKLIPVGLEADLKEARNATVIQLCLELAVDYHEPLQGEILFLTGHLDTHFEAVDLLSKQPSIDLYIGDKYCSLVHQQSIPLADEHREVFAQLLKEASSRDALIRFRGQYDPDAAFAELVSAQSYVTSKQPH